MGNKLIPKKYILIARVALHLFITYAGYVLLLDMLFFLVALANGTAITPQRIHGMLLLSLYVLLSVAFMISLFYYQHFKLPKFNGLFLPKEQFKAQYAQIEYIRKLCGSPQIHGIFIDFSIEVRAYEYTPFGHFLGRKMQLVIGLPLMMALTESELLSLITQRCACFSKKQDKDALFAYRSKMGLNAVLLWMDKKYEGTLNDSMLMLFIAFPALRQHILMVDNLRYSTQKQHIQLADEIAAGVYGIDTLASALLRQAVHLEAGTLDNFWEDITQQNFASSSLPVHLYRAMELAFLKVQANDLLPALLSKLRKENTSILYHELSLNARFDRIGIKEPIMQPIALNALSKFFTGESNNILDYLGKRWIENNKAQWENAYEAYKNQHLRLNELREEHSKQCLPVKSWLEMAQLAEALLGTEAMLEFLKEDIDKYHDDEKVLYTIGRMLVKLGDEAGVAMLEQIAFSGELLPCRYLHLMKYYLADKQDSKAIECYRKAIAYIKRDEDCREEREILRQGQIPVQADFSGNEEEMILAALKSHPQIDKVYVAKKKLSSYDEFPVYIIGLCFSSGLTTAQHSAIINELPASGLIPWDYLYVVLNRKTSRKIACRLGLMDRARLK